MAVQFKKPAGTTSTIPGGVSSVQTPETVLRKGLKSADKLEQEKVKEADKAIRQKENEVRLRYNKNTLNGIDDPTELVSFYEAQSQYYEATDRGDKAALSEQRGFRAFETYQRKLELAALKAEAGGKKGLAVTAGTTGDFLTQYDAMNTMLDNIGIRKDAGDVNPREYGAMLEQLMKEKTKLIQDYVRDPDDRNKLTSGANLFTTKGIEFGPKGGLNIVEDDPLGIDSQESFATDFDNWKQFRKSHEPLAWRQEIDENGVGRWRTSTKRALAMGDKMYLTHEKFSNYTQEGPNGEMNMVEDVSEAGDFFYEPFIARDENGAAKGLGIYDYDSGDLDVIPFTDKASELTAMLDRQEITDKQALGFIVNPQGKSSVDAGVFEGDIFTKDLIEDDSKAESWANGGRWLGEPSNNYSFRMKRLGDDIASGNLGRLSIDDEGNILMNAKLPHEETDELQGIEDPKLRDTVTRSKWFSDEAAQAEARESAEQVVEKNPDLFGSGPGQQDPQQFIQAQSGSAKSLFGFLKPVIESDINISAGQFLTPLIPKPGALPEAAKVAGQLIGPGLEQGRQIRKQAGQAFQRGVGEVERREAESGRIPERGARTGGGVGAAFLEAVKATGRQSFQNILSAFRRR